MIMSLSAPATTAPVTGSVNTPITMGIRMPKVPQLVPEANARKQATRKMMAGSILVSPALAPCISPATYTSAPKSPVMVLRVTAKVRISMAGTMALKPCVRQFIASLKETSLRHM